MKHGIVESVEEEFENADYRVAAAKGLFDMVAAGRNSLTVKILANIDSATMGGALRLSAAASSLDTRPIFVGVKTRKGVIEDSVYHRFGVPAVSLAGLKEILCNRALNYVEKGGSVVYVDGEKMRRRREALGLSLGNVSMSVGVSRKSIAEYEKGGRTRPEIAERIENVLGIPVTMNKSHSENYNNRHERLYGLEAFVDRKLKKLGFDTTPISGSVFNIAARHDDVILANVSESGRNFRRNAVMLHGIAEVTGKRAVLVSAKSSKNSLEGVPVITREELNDVDGIENFEDIVDEKLSADL
ncbi:MAG: helix-turn-helix domain-containing protein [Candidatus Aenigmarchaeota archaeon]|nr:helix-turn-helix domain-containing protein [Candidatus Aenigmarchaeota archaeon]